MDTHPLSPCFARGQANHFRRRGRRRPRQARAYLRPDALRDVDVQGLLQPALPQRHFYAGLPRIDVGAPSGGLARRIEPHLADRRGGRPPPFPPPPPLPAGPAPPPPAPPPPP